MKLVNQDLKLILLRINQVDIAWDLVTKIINKHTGQHDSTLKRFTNKNNLLRTQIKQSKVNGSKNFRDAQQ
jgi:hypothetical protein